MDDAKEKSTMVKTREEILEKLKAFSGDNVEDDTLSFIEDVTDTMNHYEDALKDSTDWKQKYEDNDKEWREKYKSRFFEGSAEQHEEPEHEERVIKSFDDLFKEGE